MPIKHKNRIKEYVGKDKKPEDEKILYKNEHTIKTFEVEKYLIKYLESKNIDIEVSYDVVANEFPYFKTIGYTEWTGSMIIYPLNFDLKFEQMYEALLDNAPIKFDYIKYLKNRLKEDPNKYKDRNKPKGIKSRDVLIVLPGSNKLKSHTCLNKLKWIYNKYEMDNIYFKPHPITLFRDVGLLMDMFGAGCVLDRDLDLYYFVKKAKIIYTTYHSESAAYSVALGKKIYPIDIFSKKDVGAFSHINRHLFANDNPQKTLNKIYNSYKSGIINPNDPDWKEKLEKYIDYILEKREKYKDFYIHVPKKKK